MMEISEATARSWALLTILLKLKERAPSVLGCFTGALLTWFVNNGISLRKYHFRIWIFSSKPPGVEDSMVVMVTMSLSPLLLYGANVLTLAIFLLSWLILWVRKWRILVEDFIGNIYKCVKKLITLIIMDANEFGEWSGLLLAFYENWIRIVSYSYGQGSFWISCSSLLWFSFIIASDMKNIKMQNIIVKGK